ncbi:MULTISPECIES: Fur family transcriptional regulator [Leuconostoc]|uniref:Ferric uptake regulator n=2 Tax=Leuconostoc kimchii TaxID=136609 RepID=D5T4C8_LEUKI|nr:MULTISPECIES: Fur family transcriptional regulator [Leuconostoc]ADG41066.1 ferric uptake regulator [Leuconostoc kimchii IMSNU 11154]AEJ30962.1 ferric uptake regulator [Leuconostoc sp. C2]QBR48059.1 transcriptional repressor [Leuconostoc kimchii]
MTNPDLRDMLQTHGLKATFQRITILDYLMTHETHPTADMIHMDLKEISLATIYNTLEKLVDVGLVIVIDTQKDDKRHYDYYGEPHYHIINNHTNEIIDADNFDVAPLFEAARQASGLNITGFHIEIYGVDPDEAK